MVSTTLRDCSEAVNKSFKFKAVQVRKIKNSYSFDKIAKDETGYFVKDLLTSNLNFGTNLNINKQISTFCSITLCSIRFLQT